MLFDSVEIIKTPVKTVNMSIIMIPNGRIGEGKK
jgi:hypothetical protein